MKKTEADPVRDMDFANARRGRVTPAQPGKTKISIRLDNAVIDHFRDAVDRAGGGNYQSLINDALIDWIRQKSMLEAVRKVVREEFAAERGTEPKASARASAPASSATGSAVSPRRAQLPRRTSSKL